MKTQTNENMLMHEDIIKIIVSYLTKNHEKLKGAMLSDKYFLVGRRAIEPYVFACKRISCSELDIVKGSIVDVLGDLLENKNYFGFRVKESLKEATNLQNTKIIPIGDSDTFNLLCEHHVVKGEYDSIKNIDKREYLNTLRNPEGFKQSAGKIEIKEDLEKILSNLYVSKSEK